MDNNIELSLLEPDEKEQLEWMWNFIPQQDRQHLTKQDLLFVLDAMDDFLQQAGLVEVADNGEMTYLDGEVDDTEQLNYLIKAVGEAAKQKQCSPLTPSQLQIIMDAELQYGIEQGWYEE